MFESSPENERAEKIEAFPQWDTGAPMPHLLQSEYKTFLIYYVKNIDPNWDGTYVKVRDVKGDDNEPIAIVEFDLCRGAVLGGLNDETISGHRLWNRGLSDCYYGAAEVKNSAWIEGMRKGNSVHPQHKDKFFEMYKHYILLFHDTTFECIARSFQIEVVQSSMKQVLDEALRKLH